jgi:hypothetical protein
MPGSLRPGDPVPAIVARNGRVEVARFAGRYVLLAVADAGEWLRARAAIMNNQAEFDAIGGHMACVAVQSDDAAELFELPGWTTIADDGRTTAQRWGALRDGRTVPLVTLVDPRSRVVAAYGGDDLAEAVAVAVAEVARLTAPKG